MILEAKYSGYIHRQAEQVERFQRMESRPIPAHFDYAAVPQLRAEATREAESNPSGESRTGGPHQRHQPGRPGGAADLSGLTDDRVGWAESSRPTTPPLVGLEDSAHPAIDVRIPRIVTSAVPVEPAIWAREGKERELAFR